MSCGVTGILVATRNSQRAKSVEFGDWVTFNPMTKFLQVVIVRAEKEEVVVNCNLPWLREKFQFTDVAHVIAAASGHSIWEWFDIKSAVWRYKII